LIFNYFGGLMALIQVQESPVCVLLKETLLPP